MSGLPGTFWSKARRTDCIVWQGAQNSKGYGCFGIDGVSQLAHRLAWEDVNGAVPKDMTIDHLCRVRSCINTDHMELVSRGENVRRAKRINVGDTCSHGHLIADMSDLYLSPRGRRECRECRKATYRRAKAKDAAA